MKLKNSVKLTVLSLSLAALAMTSCGGKSGGTDNNIILAREQVKKNALQKEEKIKTLAGLTEEIATLTAKTAEQFKNETIILIDIDLADATQRSATDLKNKIIKKLKDSLKQRESDALKKELAEKEAMPPDQVKTKLIEKLSKAKEEIVNKPAEELKQGELNKLQEKLKVMQSGSSSGGGANPVVPVTPVDPVPLATDPVSPATDPVSPATDPVSPATDPVSPATDPAPPADPASGSDPI